MAIKTKIVERPKLNFWQRAYLSEVFRGIAITSRHFWKNMFFHTMHSIGLFKGIQAAVTILYPEHRRPVAKRSRTRHRLMKRVDNSPRCVACMMCATACPANCITIEAEAAPPEWPDRDKFPSSFVLDELRCIYCGMCEEACPVDAIELTHIYDLTGETRAELMYDREKLLSVYDQTKDNPRDPVRTRRGILGPASEFSSLPTLGPATVVPESDRSAKNPTAGVIKSSQESIQ